jgi:hypothetical protein
MPKKWVAALIGAAIAICKLVDTFLVNSGAL